MPTFTAQELIDRAAAAADMHDNFVSEDTWLNWLSQERYALDLFVARSGWPLDFETSTITVRGYEDGKFVIREDWDDRDAYITLSDANIAWEDPDIAGLLTEPLDVRLKLKTGVDLDEGPFSLTITTTSGGPFITYTDGAAATLDYRYTTVSGMLSAIGAGTYFEAENTYAGEGTELVPSFYNNRGTTEVKGVAKTLYLETQPVDVMAVIAVHKVEQDGRLRLLKYKDAVTFLRQRPESPVYSGTETAYWRMRREDDAMCLNFYPDPTAGTEFLVTYIRAPERITSTSTSLGYPMGWEERIVLGMARRALDKEESDSSAIKRQMTEMDQQIEEICWNRALADSPRVRNRDNSVAEMPRKEQWAWV